MNSINGNDVHTVETSPEVKLFFSTPDSDGDIRFKISANVTNKTTETIDFISGRAVLINCESMPVVNGDESKDTFIPPGENEKLSIWCNYGKEGLIGPDAKNVHAIVQLLCCRADYVELPSITLGTQPYQVAGIRQSIDINGKAEVLSAAAWFKEADEDGESEVQCYVVVRNLTDCHITKCEVKLRLTDSRGRTLDTSEADEPITANGFTSVDCSIWNARHAQLSSGCVLHIGVTVFSTVDVQDLTSGNGELSKDI